MGSSWLSMSAACQVRNAIRNSIRRRSRDRYANAEFAMNIFRSLVGDENQDPARGIRHGEMLHFAATPITSRRKNFTKASDVSSTLQTKPVGRRSCAQKPSGGTAI